MKIFSKVADVIDFAPAGAVVSGELVGVGPILVRRSLLVRAVPLVAVGVKSVLGVADSVALVA